MADDNSSAPPAPDDSGPGTPPQTPAPALGTPQGGDQLDQAAAQVYQQHAAVFNQPVKPVTPPTPPARPAGFGKKLSDFYDRLKATNPLPSMAQTASKLGVAMERGAVDAGDGVTNTAIDATNALEGGAVKLAKKVSGDPTAGDDFDKWYHSGSNGSPPPAASTDAMFGKKQGGVYNFVEGATAFTASLEAGSELAGTTGMQPGAAKTLVKAGLVGLAQAVSTDPRAARISDMIENGAPALSNPLTQFLKSNGQDSDALARLKNGLEGSMTGFAIDKFIGGLGGLVKDIAGNGAATPAADAAIQTATDAKPDPVTAVATPDGGATIVHNPTAPTEPMRTLYRVEPSTLADQSAEAEAASRNALGPEYYAQVESEKGRLFSDAPLEEYGHGSPDHTTYSVQVPEADAESYARDHGTLGKEYLLPQEIADTKTPLGADGEPVSPTAPVPSGLEFASMADAESHAAALNESIKTSSIPTGAVDDADVAALKEAVTNAPAGAALTDVLPKGVFNYNYFGGTAATQAVVESLATKLQDAFPGLRNVVAGAGENGAELTAKAVKLASEGDADSWLGKTQSNADVLTKITYEQMASKIIVKQMAGKVAELSQAADINPSNMLTMSNLKAASTQLLHLFAETASVDSGAGRLLQSLKNQIPDVAEDGTVSTAQAADPLTKDFTTQDWGALARQVRLSGGDASLIMDSMVSKVGQVAAQNDPSKMDLFNAFRANMMLSGPKTSIVLAASQALASIQAPVEYWMGGLLKNDTTLRQQGADMMTGLWTNAGAAWKVAAKAWSAGEPILDSHTGVAQDTGQANAVGGPLGWLGTLMKVPTRVIMTVDEFYKNLNYLNSVRGLSLRASAEDIKSMPQMSLADEAQYRANHLSSDLATSVDPNGKALNPVALSYSRDATFQTPLTGFGKTLQDAAQEHPWLRLIAPYIRTPVNLARYAWQRTPVLGAMAGDMRADIAAGGDRQAVALGKQAAGAAVWGSAAMAVASGNMTGAGPTDPLLRKQWTNAGNQPYSVRIPGTNEWISYRRIDQLGTPLSMVADIAEMSGHLRETDTQNVFAKFAAGISADLTSKTFLGGMANFMDAMHSGDPKKWQQLGESLAGSVIPAIGRQMDPDPQYREVRGMIDALKERVPGFSNSLEAKRNILGEPVMKPPGYFNANMNPFTLTPGGRVDPVQDQLVQLGKGMAMPDDHVGPVDLTDRGMWKRADGKPQSPYDRMLELMSKPKDGADNLRTQLTDEINSDDWKQSGPQEQALIAGKIIKGAQKDAMDQMTGEYPGLEDAIEQAKGIKKSGLENGPGVNAPTPWTGTGNRIATGDSKPAFIQ